MVNPEKIFFLSETGIKIFSRAGTRGPVPGIKPLKQVKQFDRRNIAIYAAINNTVSIYFSEKVFGL